ncbi:hypothetical protein OH797_31765 [Streptomyces anulatus]|uniref:hypothetical protein n=1 Tax=Streptomyces anulatus TaxID=1892 RepID=UPI00386EBD6C
MPWDYDVRECTNDSTVPQEHDGECEMRTVATHQDDWRNAYQDAARRTHAVVLIRNRGLGTEAVTFKHTAGGGLCETCARHRGPAFELVGLGLRYVCDQCIRSFYEDACSRAKANGWYRPDPYRPALEKSLS